MRKFQKGISIIEIIISASIIAISVSGIFAAINIFVLLSGKNSNQTQVALLTEEAAEVVMFLRDSGYAANISTLDSDLDYYILWNGVSYSLTTTPQVDNGKFSRKLKFISVERDANDDITSSGTIDVGTKKVQLNISWDEKGENKIFNSEFLIHDIYTN